MAGRNSHWLLLPNSFLTEDIKLLTCSCKLFSLYTALLLHCRTVCIITLLCLGGASCQCRVLTG